MSRMTFRVPGSVASCEERSLRQDTDRIETQIAPELQPDLIAQVAAHRAFQSGAHQQLAEQHGARGFFSRRFGNRQTVTIGVGDNARGFHFGGLPDDAAKGALGPQPLPDFSAGIDAFNAPSFIGAAVLVEIPPGQAILGKENGGVLAQQGLELVQHAGERMGLDPDNDIVLRPQGFRIR